MINKLLTKRGISLSRFSQNPKPPIKSTASIHDLFITSFSSCTTHDNNRQQTSFEAQSAKLHVSVWLLRHHNSKYNLYIYPHTHITHIPISIIRLRDVSKYIKYEKRDVCIKSTKCSIRCLFGKIFTANTVTNAFTNNTLNSLSLDHNSCFSYILYLRIMCDKCIHKKCSIHTYTTKSPRGTFGLLYFAMY